MINRELAKAIEEVVITRKQYVDNEKSLKWADVKLSNLETLLTNVDIKDVTQMFADLRDYWDTLEVGK